MAKLPVLLAEASEFIVLFAGRDIGSFALIAVGLFDPGMNRLSSGFKLFCEISYGASITRQFDDLLAEGGWIRWSAFGHNDLGLVVKYKIVHQTGSTPEEYEGKADAALEILEAGLEEAIAVLVLPAKYRRRLRTTNMLERLNEELRRRERVIRIFPNNDAALRMIGALLVEQHERWISGKRYFNMDEYETWREARQAHAEAEHAPAPMRQIA